MSVERVIFVKEGISYTFYANNHPSPCDKKIYFGTFRDKAPAGLMPGQAYCLKEIRGRAPFRSAHAANRECYDLLDYEGDHLRKILLRDDAAEQVKDRLERGRLDDWDESIVCKIIEPRYESAEELFCNAALLPICDRLDVILQYAQGAKELQGKSVAGFSVKAYRDMKVANGVKERLADGKIRIRLVDFASIMLREDEREPVFTTVRGNGTMKLPMSRESTPPEVVGALPGTVSEKVDVYALGFMLASMFVRRDGAYVNPISIWSERLGWGDLELEELKNKLQTEFNRCARLYDTKEKAKNSWVEQELAQKGVTLCWADVDDMALLREIRALFVEATSLNPEKRPSLVGFISRLKRMITGIDAGRYLTQRCPTAVYLFHREDAGIYREIYQKAAVAQFRKDAEAFAQRGFSTYRALCVAYSGREYEQEDMEDCVNLMKYPYPCATEDELATAIGTLMTKNSRDRNCLLFGLFGAYRFFCERNDVFYFPDGVGKIYLFTPALPAKTDVEPFVYQGEDLDLAGFCELTFENFSRSGVAIQAFVERSAEGDTLPVECVYLNTHQAEEKYVPEPEKTSAHLSPAEMISAANALRAVADVFGVRPRTPDPAASDGTGAAENSGGKHTESAKNGEFLVGSTALFVETRDGERHYVGQLGE